MMSKYMQNYFFVDYLYKMYQAYKTCSISCIINCELLKMILCLCYIYGNYLKNKHIIKIRYSVEMKSDIVRLLDMWLYLGVSRGSYNLDPIHCIFLFLLCVNMPKTVKRFYVKPNLSTYYLMTIIKDLVFEGSIYFSFFLW